MRHRFSFEVRGVRFSGSHYCPPIGEPRTENREPRSVNLSIAIWRPCGTRILLPLPRGVMVAQVTLDHFVMVRIHTRQLPQNEQLTQKTLNRPKSVVTKLCLNFEALPKLFRRGDPDATLRLTR